mgnify:CR=1 FL=1
MVRSIISIIVASTLIIGCAVYENLYLKSTFDGLTEVFLAVKGKIDDENCDESDVVAAQKCWLDKKKKLHVFIPHTEIKEVDLWVSECVAYSRAGNYEEAGGKVEVILELFEQIPKTFLVRIENLF